MMMLLLLLLFDANGALKTKVILLQRFINKILTAPFDVVVVFVVVWCKGALPHFMLLFDAKVRLKPKY